MTSGARTTMSKRRSVSLRAGMVGVSLLTFASRARAVEIEIGPADDLKAKVAGLTAGQELVLRGGTYSLSGYFGVTLVGTAAAPIAIRAKVGETVLVQRAAADQNMIDVVKARFLTISGIDFSGGSRGLRLIDASDVTIRDCEVHATADVAISANDVGSDYARVSLVHNHLHDTGGTGEGMYLGCNSNGCKFHDGLIAENHIHHTNGPAVSQGDGIEIKEGSYANVVRDNVIHDTGYPCIITYSTVGNGGPNILERNVMWACGDHGIQSAADVVIRNNIVLGAAGSGIANQPHQAGTPSNIQIVNNTIIAPAHDAITCTGITGSVLIANNAVYAPAGSAVRASGTLGQVTVKNNVGVGALQGAASGLVVGSLAGDFVAANLGGGVPNDVFPKVGSKLIGAGDAASLPTDDFNGTARGGVADVGAYRFAATNPGGALAAAFKASIAPASDGGTPGAPGGSSGAAPAGGGASSGAPPVNGASEPSTPSGAEAAGTESDGGCSAVARGEGARQRAASLVAIGVVLGGLLRRRARRR